MSETPNEGTGVTVKGQNRDADLVGEIASLRAALVGAEARERELEAALKDLIARAKVVGIASSGRFAIDTDGHEEALAGVVEAEPDDEPPETPQQVEKREAYLRRCDARYRESYDARPAGEAFEAER